MHSLRLGVYSVDCRLTNFKVSDAVPVGVYTVDFRLTHSSKYPIDCLLALTVCRPTHASNWPIHCLATFSNSVLGLYAFQSVLRTIRKAPRQGIARATVLTVPVNSNPKWDSGKAIHRTHETLVGFPSASTRTKHLHVADLRTMPRPRQSFDSVQVLVRKICRGLCCLFQLSSC